MTLAEVLRAAADRIDQLASAATPGPWIAQHLPYGHPNVAWDIAAPNFRDPNRAGVCHTNEGDAAYVATMGPQVASHLASWLRGHAEYTAAAQCAPDGHAVALARVVLGETGEQP